MTLEAIRAEITKTDKEIIRLIAHGKTLQAGLQRSRSTKGDLSMMSSGLLSVLKAIFEQAVRGSDQSGGCSENI